MLFHLVEQRIGFGISCRQVVIVKGTSGSITVQGSSSSIEVSRINNLPSDAIIDLSTTYKTIDLTLPDNSDAAIAVSAGHKRIETDFPVYLIGSDEDKIESAKDGRKAFVRLKTSGQIVIKKH